MNDIQKARAVLAKWRGAAEDGAPDQWIADAEDARLIVGTAGNPELLDVIDALLAQEQRRRASMHDNMSSNLSHHATRIAAAIIAADDRMQQ